MPKVKVKLDVNRYDRDKRYIQKGNKKLEIVKEELVISGGERFIDMGFYSDKLPEHIGFNIESIPKIVDTLLYIHNMITRLNKEEDENAKLVQ
jgi:hypothetical protein|tara:strand:+ start:296 stop:574 length:279 start_codon:yes stop_codon:yes gene_type:complete